MLTRLGGRHSAACFSSLVPVTVGLLRARGSAAESAGYCKTHSCSTRSLRTSSKMASGGRTFAVEPKGQHTASLIFLHGLGDTGEGWSMILGDMSTEHLRIVCPTAPTQSVTVNMGMKMPSWFDIYGLGADAKLHGKQDEEGVKKSSEKLHEMIKDEEKRGVPRDRIVIGGFSQGGAVALHAGLTSSSPLGGIVALSTYLPMHKTIAAVATEASRTTPVLQCHGGEDSVVPIVVGEVTSSFLSGFVKEHKLKVYPDMEHSSCPEELQYLGYEVQLAVTRCS